MKGISYIYEWWNNVLYIRVLEICKGREYGLMGIWACTAETLDLLPLNLESFGVILHVCPLCCDGSR